jgi:predicted acylesterase/phospholipase RssA
MMLQPSIALTGYHSTIIAKDHHCSNPPTAIAQKVGMVVAAPFKALFQSFSDAVHWVSNISIFRKTQLPYVILALDGGGVRGKVSLAALKLIEEEIGDKVINAVDCIAGVSTGAVIGAALSVPCADNPYTTRYSAKDVDELYDDFAQKVFANSTLQNIQTVHGSIGAKYPSPREVLENLVNHEEIPLKASVAKKLIITSVDLLSANTVYFENHESTDHHLKDENIQSCIIDNGATFIDALEATTAAPTYFPTKIFKNYNLVDGGIAENNPAEIATLLAMKSVAKDRPILVISLGTGKMSNEPITKNIPLNWGWLQWVEPLIDYLFDTKAQLTNAQMEFLAENNPRISYVRFQAMLEDPSQAPLDNASPENMQKLANLGNRTFKHFLDNGGREHIIAPLKQRLKALNSR